MSYNCIVLQWEPTCHVLAGAENLHTCFQKHHNLCNTITKRLQLSRPLPPSVNSKCATVVIVISKLKNL